MLGRRVPRALSSPGVQGAWGRCLSVSSAPGAEAQVRRTPTSERSQEGAAQASAAASADGGEAGVVPKKESTSSKLGWLIPALGLPGLVAWYLYDQGYVQQEHEAHIQSLHEDIKERREQMNAARLSFRTPAPRTTANAQGPNTTATTTATQQQQQQGSGSGASAPGSQSSSSSFTSSAPGRGPSGDGGQGSSGKGGDDVRGGSGKAAGAAAAAGVTPEGDSTRAEQSSASAQERGSTTNGRGGEILSVVGEMEGQEQEDAQRSARSVRDAAQQQQKLQQEQEQQQKLQQEQEREQQQKLQQEQREQQQREQQQKQQQHAESEQQMLQGLQEGLGKAAAQHAEAFGYEHAPARAKSIDPLLPAVPRGRMGVSLDLTPAGLIQFAIERRKEVKGGGAASEDWEGFLARHGQAAADAELFARAARQIAQWHEAEVAQVQSIADRNAARVDEVTAMAQASTESFKRLLKQHQEMAAELRDLEVKQAERRLVLAARKALEVEGKARAEALDAVRQHLGGLALAHDARASQQSASRLSHAITLAVLDASAALDAGASIKPHLDALLAAAQVPPARGTSQAMVAQSFAHADAAHATAASHVDSTLARVEGKPQQLTAEGQQTEKAGAGEDAQQQQQQLQQDGRVGSAEGSAAIEEVVGTVVSSMPTHAVRQGLATTQQLSARLQSLHSVLSQLSMLPAAAQQQAGTAEKPSSSSNKPSVDTQAARGGGILSHAVARLAAWLKVDESHAVQALGQQEALSHGSVEAALAVAQAQVSQGKLANAADTLARATEGTEAAAAVASWCEDARQRAAADQALRFLRAHATTLAASSI